MRFEERIAFIEKVRNMIIDNFGDGRIIAAMLDTSARPTLETVYLSSGPTDAPAVVLANGLAADLTIWEPQLDVLESRFRVLRYDLRGHGGSAATPGDYSLALLAADLVDVMDRLRIEAAHLVGTSIGGMVAQYLGAHQPGRVSSLTLVATSCDASREAWAARVSGVRRDGVASQVEPTLDRWFTPGFRNRHPALMDRMRAMIRRTSRDGYAGCAAAIRDMELSDAIGGIAAPTLVIAGEDDQSTSLPAVRRIAERIPGARFVAVPEAAHMPTMEQPERCNALIGDFLDSLTAIAGTAPGNGR